jgi:hypothetical protein
MKENRFKIAAAVLLCSFTLSMVFPSELWASADDPKGWLMLIASHAGLVVKIDNQFVGLTPDVFELTPGLHKVVVEHPDRINWFEENWVADVQILANDTLRAPVIFKYSYSIHSQPFGATVLKGTELVGETPIFFKLPENEIAEITLSKPGYRDTTLTLGLTPQRFFDVELAAAKIPLHLALGSVNADKRPRSRVILYSAAALTLAAGGLAFYFRSRGDDKYESYLRTGDPEFIEKYYNDAKHFDRLAAVSFGIFQISFVASFYLLLKEANRQK